jgi:hypothetical protein
MRLYLTIFMLLMSPLFAAVESKNDAIAVRGFADSVTENRVLAIARRCEVRIDSLLGPATAERPWLRIYPPEGLPLESSGLLLGLARTENEWHVAPVLARALLHRRMDRELEPAPLPDRVPEWLVAAIAHQVVTERGDFSPLRRFPACRELLSRNQIPDLTSLVDQAVSPGSAIFYQLYGEFTSALALAIRRADREAIGRILQSSAGNLAAAKVLDKELAFFANGDLQGWWRERFPATVFSIFNPIPHEQAVAELHKAQTITVVLSDTEEGRNVVLVPMDQLYERHRRPTLDPVSLEAAHVALFNLLQHAPVTLREPINQYLGALNALREGSRFTFSRRIRSAKRSLETHRQRGPEISEQLRAFDHRKTYHELFAYTRYFGHIPPTEYSRELRNYLDTLQRGPR